MSSIWSTLAVTLVACASLACSALTKNPAVAWSGLAATVVVAISASAIARRSSSSLGAGGDLAMDDPYEYLEKLGEGSMGEVWRARHRRLGRLSAVKLIKPGSVDVEDLKRFEREARVTASLRSPHTVEVHDFGVRDNGTFYYAMELLDGIDLQQLVRRFGPLPAGRVIRLLEQACHSLDEAHQAGLVHRDLKPANIILCRYGRDVDWIKIVDFGLAKEPERTGDATQLTKATTVLGTAAYLAPESLKGSRYVDHRADLYALGCIAFWLLTGELVFRGKTAIEMAKAHAVEPPRRTSQLNAEVPEELDSLIAACLEKKPERRPQSASAIRESLRAVPIDRAWTEDDAGAWWDSTWSDSARTP